VTLVKRFAIVTYIVSAEGIDTKHFLESLFDATECKCDASLKAFNIHNHMESIDSSITAIEKEFEFDDDNDVPAMEIPPLDFTPSLNINRC
jgi:hypothetical protein